MVVAVGCGGRRIRLLEDASGQHRDRLWGVNRRRKGAGNTLSALKPIANPIEAHFGPLRQFTIADSDYPDHTVQTRALHACLRRHNANARHRDVLAAERKERAGIRSEKGIRWGGRPLTAAA